jgi:transcriptional regulator with XRE-family HTH domain
MASAASDRIGGAIRDARQARGWSQAELGAQSGLSQSAIAAIEKGNAGRIDSLERICTGLGGELVLDVRLPFAGDGPRQVDSGHARCVGSMRRLLECAGHICVTEQEILDGPWRGWIDLVAYDSTLRRLVIVEVKTELQDAGALDRQVGRYVRLCLEVARRHGWSVVEIAVIVVVLATARNDAFLIANRQVLGPAFPIRGRRAISCVLDRGPIQARMLLMIDPRRRGRRALLRSAADGRRTAAPYTDYRAFVATLDAARNVGRGGDARGGAPVGKRPVMGYHRSR